MKSERVRVLVDSIAAEGSFIAPLRILHRACLATGLRIAVHHLDGHVAIACVDQQPRAVCFVYRSVCVGLFELCKPQ